MILWRGGLNDDRVVVDDGLEQRGPVLLVRLRAVDALVGHEEGQGPEEGAADLALDDELALVQQQAAHLGAAVVHAVQHLLDGAAPDLDGRADHGEVDVGDVALVVTAHRVLHTHRCLENKMYK